MQLSERAVRRKRVSTAGMRASLSPRPRTQSQVPDDGIIVLPDGPRPRTQSQAPDDGIIVLPDGPRPRTQSQAPDDGIIVLPDGGVILPSILSPISRGKRRQSRQSPSGSGTSTQLARASTSPGAEQPPVDAAHLAPEGGLRGRRTRSPASA